MCACVSASASATVSVCARMEHWKLRKPLTHTSVFVRTLPHSQKPPYCITAHHERITTWNSIEYEAWEGGGDVPQQYRITFCINSSFHTFEIQRHDILHMSNRADTRVCVYLYWCLCARLVRSVSWLVDWLFTFTWFGVPRQIFADVMRVAIPDNIINIDLNRRSCWCW